MTLVALDDLCYDAINLIREKWNDEWPAEIRLFQNDYYPDRGSELLDFEEADVDGYAPIQTENWSDPADIGGHVWQTEADVVTFTMDGSATTQTIYGYYVADPDDDSLWYAERFDEPYEVDTAAFVITFRPTINSRSLFGGGEPA